MTLDAGGDGLVATTEQCLLNRNRNPILSREDVEERLARSRLVAPFDGLVVSGDLTQQLGSPVELIKSFGGRPQYLQALQTLERELYRPTN